MANPSAFGALFDDDPDPFLHDEQGDYYRAEQLPCTSAPQLWDYDATAEDKRTAKVVCGQCPARQACYSKRLQLSTRADGVWGGVIIRRGKEVREPDDHTVLMWARKYGIDLPAEGEK